MPLFHDGSDSVLTEGLTRAMAGDFSDAADLDEKARSARILLLSGVAKAAEEGFRELDSAEEYVRKEARGFSGLKGVSPRRRPTSPTPGAVTSRSSTTASSRGSVPASPTGPTR